MYNKRELGLIQVAFSLENDIVREREFRALVATAKYLKANIVCVITFNEEEVVLKDGVTIQVIPVWRWLLGK